MRLRQRSDAGASAVEFGLIVPLFATLLFGMIQFGFYFWTAQNTSSAARETARRIVVGDCWSQSAMDIFAKGHNPFMTGSVTMKNGSGTTVTDPSTLSVGDTIVVAIKADANLIEFLPMPDSGSGEGIVVRSYQARMEDSTSSGSCPS